MNIVLKVKCEPGILDCSLQTDSSIDLGHLFVRPFYALHTTGGKRGGGRTGFYEAVAASFTLLRNATD